MRSFARWAFVLSMIFAACHAFAAEPAVTLVSVSDAPDPLSPPVAGSSNIRGNFQFPSRGPDVDTVALTERSYLRMTVALSNSAGAVVRTLSAQTSAAQMPGSPNVQTKTLTVSWDGKDAAGQPVPDTKITYNVSGGLVLVRQLKHGPNTNPTESTLASSNSLVGTLLLDATRPVVSNPAPPDGSFVGAAKPAISASFSDPAPAPGVTPSGVNAAATKIFLDGAEVTAQGAVSAAGFSFTPGTGLNEGPHAPKAAIADFAGNVTTAQWTFTVDLSPPVVSARVPAPDAFVKAVRPALSAEYADALSGVDASSVQVTLDGSAVAASANAAGFAFTPPAPLAEGLARPHPARGGSGGKYRERGLELLRGFG